MKPKGFIFGGFVNGLGLVRSLAKEGIQSDVFDVKPCLAAQSKSATYIQSPNPKNEDEFIHFVIKKAKNQILKPVCYITNDIWLVPLLKNKKNGTGKIYLLKNFIKQCFLKLKRVQAVA